MRADRSHDGPDTLATLVAQLDPEPRIGRLVVVRGATGSGRTTMLNAAREQWLRRAHVILVTPGADAAVADPFAVTATRDAVTEQFEEYGDHHLAAAISAVAAAWTSARSDEPREAGHTPRRFEQRMSAALLGLFRQIRAHGPSVLALDDAHLVRDPILVLDAARRAGLLAVACYAQDRLIPDPSTAHLAARADLLMELGPLHYAGAADVVADAVRRPVDPAFVADLARSLGPLFGSPKAVGSTVRRLVDRGRVTAMANVACLADPDSPISLPWAHPLTRAVGQLGSPAATLLLIIATAHRLHIGDLALLAGTVGRDAADCGRMVDALVDRGAVTATADGRLASACPALVATLAAGADPAQLRSGYAHLAAAMAERSVVADADIVARLALAAGDELARNPTLLHWARNNADRLAASEPQLAARLHAALLHRCPAAPRPHDVVNTLQLALRSGQLDIIRVAVDRCDPTDGALPADLAVARILVHAHDGEPNRALPRRHQPAPTLMTWAEVDVLRRAVGFEPEAVHRVVTRTGEFGGLSAADRRPLVEAAAWGDGCSVLQLLLSDRYSVPTATPLALWQQTLALFRGCDWTAALSAARRLVLAGGSRPMVELGRLIAAEICLERGDVRQAAFWQAGSVPTTRQATTGSAAGAARRPGTSRSCAALRAWVECGRQLRRGQPAEALKHGLAVAGSPVRPTVGIDLLLLRLIATAVQTGQRELAEHLLAQLQELEDRGRWPVPAAVLALARVLVRHGAETAVEAGAGSATAADLADLVRTAPYLIDGQLRRLLRSKGILAPGRPHPSTGQEPTFSAAELRLLRLIRQGRTNRQIAARLQISERRVEHQLTELFARVGCRSRAELTARTAGLLPPAGQHATVRRQVVAANGGANQPAGPVNSLAAGDVTGLRDIPRRVARHPSG